MVLELLSRAKSHDTRVEPLPGPLLELAPVPDLLDVLFPPPEMLDKLFGTPVGC